MHPQANDYRMPCGCHRITHLDKHGRIESIDEGWCSTHAEVIWPRILPGSRIIKHTENPQEVMDHAPTEEV